jgi:hypothetical protein
VKNLKTRTLLALGLGALLLLAHNLPGQQAAPQKATPKADNSTAQSAMTNQDVVRLVKANLSAAIIIAKIKQSETKFDTSVDGLVALKEAGVSDGVIAIMLNPHEALKDQEDSAHPPAPPTGKDPAENTSGNLSGATGEIDGQVLLTADGQEMGPSRFARVNLFDTAQANSEPMIRGIPELAEEIADKRSGDAEEGEYEAQLDEVDCLKALIGLSRQLQSGNLQARTDESGNFTFGSLKPDKFTIIVFGHAGQNAALWISEVSVVNGKKADLKMREPAISCFDPNAAAPF